MHAELGDDAVHRRDHGRISKALLGVGEGDLVHFDLGFGELDVLVLELQAQFLGL